MKNVLFLYLIFLAVTAYGQSTIKLSQLPLVQATNTGSSDSVPITYYESSPTETARLLLQDLVNIPAFQTEFNTLIPPQSSHTGDCLFTNGTNTYWTACLSQESENANTVFAGPSSGSPAVPTFRALTGADLPTPTTSSLGGVKAINSVSHEWVSSISSSGVPGLTQPSCSDLSNAAASCSTDTTNASNITSGTLDTTLLPANAILGTDGTTAGVLGLSNGNAGGALVSLQNNSATSAYNFNLPSTAGVSGQVLMSGGGGTNAMTWTSALSNPMTTTGDIIYGGTSGAPTRLAGNTSATTELLTSTGTGSAALAPSYSTLGSIVGSVTSSTTGKEHIERVYFGGTSNPSACSSSPCTIYSQSGGISSVTRVGTGQYTITFNSGEFSAAPSCIVSPVNTGAPNGYYGQTYSASATSVNVATQNSLAADAAVNVICMGAD